MAFVPPPMSVRIDLFTERLPDAPGCWLWRGQIDRKGYGCLKVRNRLVRAHRESYKCHKGSIPKGKLVLHRCDVRACVRPDHLMIGTHRDNLVDAISKGRQTPPPPQVGETQWQTRLTDQDVCDIRDKIRRGIPRLAIRSEYGISKSILSRIELRRTWRHLAEIGD